MSDNEREQRYAEAMVGIDYLVRLRIADPGQAANVYHQARAVMAVADAEHAELRAEVDQLRAALMLEQERTVLADREADAAERALTDEQAKVADAWDAGFEAAYDWIGNNPGPSGIWSDPPSNPHCAALAGPESEVTA